MAKLNPLLLLGGAAAALFVLSKGKKKSDKKANGDNKNNTEKTADELCDEIRIGKARWADVRQRLIEENKAHDEKARSGQADWEDFEYSDVMKGYEFAMVKSHVLPEADRIEKELDQLQADGLREFETPGVLAESFNRQFPTCKVTSDWATDLMQSVMNPEFKFWESNPTSQQLLFMFFAGALLMELEKRGLSEPIEEEDGPDEQNQPQDDCMGISLGSVTFGEFYADAMARLKKSINEGTMNPVSGKFKDALDYARDNYGQLAVQDAPPDIGSFNDIQLSGYIINLQNKAFPNCQITMSEALSMMDKAGELGVQAILGFTPREAFTIVFMNSAVNALMSEGLIDPEQPMFGQGFFN